MNLNRPDMTEDVKYKDYTNESLQKDSNPATMEVVTQTNAVIQIEPVITYHLRARVFS